MFGKREPAAPRQIAREAKRETRRGQRDIEREIAALERQEKQLVTEIKNTAKRGNPKATRILAKQLVQLRNQRDKLIGVKASVGAVGMQASAMAANVGAMHAVASATKAIGAVNATMDAQGTMQAMQQFQRQMEIMNVKEEMLDETLSDAFDNEEVEEEADGIVEQTLAEIGVALDSTMADAPTRPVASGAAAAEPAASPAQANDDARLADLEAQLARLAS